MWLSAISEPSNYPLPERSIIVMALGRLSIWLCFCLQHIHGPANPALPVGWEQEGLKPPPTDPSPLLPTLLPGCLLINTPWCVCVGDDITCCEMSFVLMIFQWLLLLQCSFSWHFFLPLSILLFPSWFYSSFPLCYSESCSSLPLFFPPSNFQKTQSHLASRGVQMLFMNSEL